MYADISTHLLKTTYNLDTPLLLVGDLNSRTVELNDYCDFDDDNNTKSNEPPTRTTPSKRRNCDEKFNQMGTKLIDMCKAHDLQILNGRTFGDRTGSFTYFDRIQGASAIDVAIASDSMQPMIKSFLVQHQTEVSQHCKIITRIKNLKENIAEEAKSNVNYPWTPVPQKYIWQEHSAEQLARTLTSPELRVVTEELDQLLEAGLVEQASYKMDELYTKAADIALQVRPPEEQLNIHINTNRSPGDGMMKSADIEKTHAEY